MIGCAATSLVAAMLLASNRSIPSWLGRTALGQVLLSEGALVMGLLALAGNAISPAVGWSASAIGVTAFCAGLCVEGRARQLAEPVGPQPQ